MFEVFLVLYSTTLFHLVWNIQQRSRKKGIDMLSGVYWFLIYLIALPWVFMLRWERKTHIEGAFFVLITSVVIFLLSRKPIERLFDRLDL
jgi:hypothetical protein